MIRFVLKIIHGLLYFFFICLFWLLFPISNLINRKKTIWIITERGYDARDNGFHLFKYIQTIHPEVKCYYTIRKRESDYNNVKEFKNVIEHGSLHHIFLFSCARVKISSTVNGFAPNKYYAKYMLRHHLQGLNVGIKHGIFKNIHPNYFKTNSHLDLLICGAKPEYDFVKQEFGYNDREVAYCGLARFDGLHNVDTKTQLLIMPTFRDYLVDLNNEEFSNTVYFKKWDGLLKQIDKEISKKMKVVFYIHAVFQKYVNLFAGRYNNIVVAEFNKFDVQRLLKESKILITDFSSVFFDFAYMRKPIIYYQFDESDYYSLHYKKGYFDYRVDGFGDVCINQQSVMKSLKSLLLSNFSIQERYVTNIERFFPLVDDKNCERIFERICERL